MAFGAPLSPFSSAGTLRWSLRNAQAEQATALERLSTGKRINRGADDPAGVVAAESLRSEVTSLESNIKRGEQQLKWLGATDGALGVVGDLLTKLDGIVVSAANTGGLSARERAAFQTEVNQILDAIDYANQTTTYKRQQVLGAYGANNLGRISLERPGKDDDAPPTTVSARLADLRSGGVLSLDSGNLEAAQDSVRSALDTILKKRGATGAAQKGLESDLRQWAKQLEDTTGALSLVEDADFAEEAARLVRGQLLEQASISAILVGRQSAASVLDLLENATGVPTTKPVGGLKGGL